MQEEKKPKKQEEMKPKKQEEGASSADEERLQKVRDNMFSSVKSSGKKRGLWETLWEKMSVNSACISTSYNQLTETLRVAEATSEEDCALRCAKDTQYCNGFAYSQDEEKPGYWKCEILSHWHVGKCTRTGLCNKVGKCMWEHAHDRRIRYFSSANKDSSTGYSFFRPYE